MADSSSKSKTTTSSSSLDATRSLRPKSFSRTKLTDSLVLDDKARFVQSALSTLRSGTFNEIDARMNTSKFEMHRYRAERMDFESRLEDERRQLEDRHGLRQTMLEKDRRAREEQTKFVEDMTVRWKATQKVKLDRTKRDLQFELATKKLEDLKLLKTRQEHDADEKQGVVAFERNLKRLGLAGGEGPDMRLAVSYEAQPAFEKRLAHLAEASKPKDEEIESFKADLKERTAEKRAARYEKARRRRRALVDQHENTH